VQDFDTGFLLQSSDTPNCADDLFNNASEQGWPLEHMYAERNGQWQSSKTACATAQANGKESHCSFDRSYAVA
jgi:hypothetical protein